MFGLRIQPGIESRICFSVPDQALPLSPLDHADLTAIEVRPIKQLETRSGETQRMPEKKEAATDTMAKENSTFSLDAEAIDCSQPFIGRWNKLISTTNWDKGEVISQWRSALRDSGEPASSWSDEAWSQLVGGVTSQHVGRLRRTHERFGQTFHDYKGLFWSHFYAALDWDDAEMWLEGAVQNAWSISGMRHQRWEALGKQGDAPSDSDIVETETAEETQSLALSDKARDNDREYIEGPRHEGPDFGDEERSSGKSGNGDDEYEDADPPGANKPGVRLFESFTDLPEDVAAASDAFKVAIIRHRAGEWDEFPRADCLGLLDALKQLAKADEE